MNVAVMIKCKMCGGDLQVELGNPIATCEYCGTTQTVPSQDSEKKLALFERANRLRLQCEFDKAASVYESIVPDFPAEAEAYWGMLLCRYGIEYVDDPKTGRKIPTCHRSSFSSVMEDKDFEQVMETADPIARKLYREEAKQIEELRKGIIEVSGREDPYDVFICYKETDENGERTRDSVMAQEVYDALTTKGYRVFFSRITLEDKLGQEYEPYIFAALNSAKVMLAFGTSYDYFNAVWVHNEWSRYLKLMERDRDRRLIPCYADIDAYDIPKEFQKLQGQDMSKLGAVQDLVRGVEKLLGQQPQQTVSASVQQANLERMMIFNSAVDKMGENTIPALKVAVEKLESISNWDAANQKLELAREQLKKLQRRKKTKRFVILGSIFIVIAAIVLSTVINNAKKQREKAAEAYSNGETAYENYFYGTAADYFRSAGNYEDAQDRAEDAEALLQDAEAALHTFVENLNQLSDQATNMFVSPNGVIDAANLGVQDGVIEHDLHLSWQGVPDSAINPEFPGTDGTLFGINTYDRMSYAVVYDANSESVRFVDEDRKVYSVTFREHSFVLSGDGSLDGTEFTEWQWYMEESLRECGQAFESMGMYYAASACYYAVGETDTLEAQRRAEEQKLRSGSQFRNRISYDESMEYLDMILVGGHFSKAYEMGITLSDLDSKAVLEMIDGGASEAFLNIGFEMYGPEGYLDSARNMAESIPEDRLIIDYLAFQSWDAAGEMLIATCSVF